MKHFHPRILFLLWIYFFLNIKYFFSYFDFHFEILKIYVGGFGYD